MVDLAASVWRDFVTDGVPASGTNKPQKSKIRQWGAYIESIITAFTSNGGLIYSTLAAMNADLAHGANSSAWVIGDATVANNGIYQKLGASGTGSWTRVADLPYGYIKASNAGAGTANAIVATTAIPLPANDAATLIALNIFVNNIGAATVAFNGGSPLAIKTNNGNDVQANYLVAGAIVAGYVTAGTFRLISDVSSAADRAAAEAAAAAAAASASTINLPSPVASTALLRNAGNTAYITQTSAQFKTWLATTAADVAFTQSGTGAVATTAEAKLREWVSILDFGGVGDGNIANANVNATALANALATGKTVFIPYTASGYHFGTNTITLGTGQRIVGENKVVLKTTTTTMMFSCTGYGQEWGVSNVKIDATGCGASSTIFRFRTASAVVYRGRFDNIDFLNQYEAFGDEASSNYVVDMRFTNIAFLLSLGRPIYIRHSRGFFYWENIQHALNTSARATSWECGRFEDAVGLEINRWDCSGGPPITNSNVTISIASPGVVTWTGHNLVAGDAVRFATTGSLPTGLAVATTYFVKTVIDANNFTVSATSGGAAINTSGTQSGTHTATRAAVYQSGAYGLVITTSTSVWLNRVEVDSTWGNGIILSNIRFLRTNQISAYHNLGNQITCSAITESALSDTIITGASGDIGDGNGGGLSFDTASSNVAISNIDITNCSASALVLNNVTKISVSNYNGYSNTGYALAFLGTTDLCVVSGGAWSSNTAGALLDSASGTKNVVRDIAGYNPIGAAGVTTAASPWTYTAGRSPETLYVAATTSISQITQGGVSILPQATGANGNFTIHLGPNEAAVITYTGTLVAKKMVH